SRKLETDAALQHDIDRIEAIWESCLDSSGGPWLFGEFGIVDAMYAPVVLRFNSYQPALRSKSAGYMRNMLANAALNEWIAAGRTETEVVPEDEVGFLRGEPDWQ